MENSTGSTISLGYNNYSSYVNSSDKDMEYIMTNRKPDAEQNAIGNELYMELNIHSKNQSNSSQYAFDNELSWAEELGHTLTLYYTPALVCVGSIGNILSVLVFFKTKLRKLSSSYYLAAIGISDTCFLTGLLIGWLNFIDINIYNRDIYCQLITYFSGLCSFLSVWFVVAFTVERFIAVLHPLKRQTMCTVKRAKMVLCGLTTLGGVISTPYLFYSAPQYSPQIKDFICDVREEYKHHMTIFNYIDTILVFIIPFTAIVILNTFTAITVWRVAGVRRTMTMPRRKPNVRDCRKTVGLQQCTHPNGQHSIIQTCPKNNKRVSNSSQIKVTKMLLIVSSVFVCFNLPSYIMRVRAYIEPDASQAIIITQYYCWLIFNTNFGINFALYCVSGQNFRKAVISMFSNRINQRQAQLDGGTQVTVSEYIRSTGSSASPRRPAQRNGSTCKADTQEFKLLNIRSNEMLQHRKSSISW